MPIFRGLRSAAAPQAGYASGGEQQMCAIGRGDDVRPKLILLDEPSMGLAPQVVEEIFAIVRFLNEREGVSFLLAEQNASKALQVALRFGYILETGRVVLDGAAEALRSSEDVREFVSRRRRARSAFVQDREDLQASEALAGLEKVEWNIDDRQLKPPLRRCAPGSAN